MKDWYFKLQNGLNEEANLLHLFYNKSGVGYRKYIFSLSFKERKESTIHVG